MNEPIKHHYIPQFILKNFSFDGKGNVNYYDITTQKSTAIDTRYVFMANNLYRDEINTPDYPTKLEHDFAAFEAEVSKIIKNKFLIGDKITLTLEEDAKLRLFLAIMPLRSERTKKQFEESNKCDRKFYKTYQRNGNFTDFWKRNLGYIVKCRSIKEVLNHEKIDHPIKVFLRRDTVNILGMYFAVVECKENAEFIISDCYPLVVNEILPNNLPIHMYSVYPISPSRAILLISVGVTENPQYLIRFRPSIATPPSASENGTYTISVRKIYPEEVKPINTDTYNSSQNGIVYLTKQFE